MLLRQGNFPDLNWNAVSIDIPEGVTPEPLARGFNSRPWKIGNQVVKVTSQTDNPHDLLDSMLGEHNLLENHVGDHMPPTNYAVVERVDGKGAHVVTTQPFIEGVHLPDFLNKASNPVDELRDFLRKCRQVYKETGLMPDIANIQQGFNVLGNTNIIIGEDQRPILVDTTFGKIQRSKSLGPTWNTAIYCGALLASARLYLDSGRRTS